MVESDDLLTVILKATADPTRRAILTLVCQEGVMRVTELAAHFDVSLNAVSKHIKVLEEAGLVRRETRWREHLIRPELDRLAVIDQWFRDLRLIWEQRLEALDHLLMQETKDD
jgi:DNA-binding transcriptional ArsR family regulator